MKKVLVLVAVALMFAAPAMADIANTLHDLSSTSTSGGATSDTDKICVFCHTPHGASSVPGPLWNRAAGAAITNAYGNPAGTMNAIPSVANMNTSDAPLCMTCHDGTGLGSLTNPPNALGANPTITDGGNVVGGLITGDALFTGDFSNDHPVGFNYADADGELELKATAETTLGAGSLSYGGGDEMWCSSCHDVHGVTGVPTFLRVDNAASALCIACHIK